MNEAALMKKLVIAALLVGGCAGTGSVQESPAPANGAYNRARTITAELAKSTTVQLFDGLTAGPVTTNKDGSQTWTPPSEPDAPILTF